MSGGDKNTGHNVLRDRIYKQAQLGGIRPKLEAAHLLVEDGRGTVDDGGGGSQGARGDGGEDAGRRPADVLICGAQDIWTGSRGHSGEAKVALDVGVVCPEAQGHLGEAAAEVLGAAEAYCKYKCNYKDTERKCREKGIIYQPMIFESTGGVGAETEKVIKSINRAVAENTNTPYGEVAQYFWQRLSIDIQRAGHLAYARRVTTPVGLQGDWMGWVVEGASGLEEVGG